MSRPVTIYAEMTPNPSTMKFVADIMLIEQGSVAEFLSISDCKGHSSFAEALFNFPFVTGVFIANNFVTVYKNEAVDWGDIVSELREYIRTWIVENDVAIIPWLVGDEWKKVQKIKCKYMFGHFELPHFKMNAMVEMPDIGTIRSDHFKNAGHVFTGHFHKRQHSGNISYIGNPFPHNFADVWDDDRGAMFLEWDKQPEYKIWQDAPKYRSIDLSKLLEDPETVLEPNSYIRVKVDLDI